MSWADDLQKLTTKGGKDLGQLCKAIKVELFSGIVSDTRVANPSAWKVPDLSYIGGRLRGNWQVTELSPASGEIDRKDISGAIVNGEVEKKSTADGLTYFTNNLPYAKKFEEEDAMVARNVIRVKQNIKEMAAKVKG